MSYGSSSVIIEVLRDLGALDAFDTVSAEDSARVQFLLGPIQIDLAARRIADINSVENIPDVYFRAFVELVAEHASPRFGKGDPDPARIATIEARLLAASRLDRNQATALTRAVLERLDVLGAERPDRAALDGTAISGAIQAVLDDLSARRVIAIGNEAAIGSSAFPHLVTLVAARCLPAAVAADAIQATEAQLASIARLDRTQATPLVRSVLDRLDQWGAGSFAVDATTVAAEIQPALDNLAARNVIYIADVDALDDMLGVTAPLVRYLAGWLAPKPMGEVIAQAEAELRTLQRIGKGTGRMLRVDPALRPRRTLGRMC